MIGIKIDSYDFIKGFRVSVGGKYRAEIFWRTKNQAYMLGFLKKIRTENHFFSPLFNYY
jgi:hypothetical protein